MWIEYMQIIFFYIIWRKWQQINLMIVDIPPILKIIKIQKQIQIQIQIYYEMFLICIYIYIHIHKHKQAKEIKKNIYKSYYQFQIFIIILTRSLFKYLEKQMAEAVKNSTRKRRPPSHFHQGYNEDNFEPGNNQYFGSKEQSRQSGDPYSMNAVARLLAKFVNSANKKTVQAKIKKNEQEFTPPQKKQPISQSKNQAKQDRSQKQQRGPTSIKSKQISQIRQGVNRQQAQKVVDKGAKKNQTHILPPQLYVNSNANSSMAEIKNIKSQQSALQSSVKNSLSSDNVLQSMAKVNRQQFLKFFSKGNVDPNLYRQKLMSQNDVENLRNLGKFSENILKQTLQGHQSKHDEKLFKRASFHIGIAYNIHIQNVRKKNPNFTPDDVDPTYVSRKLKQQSLQYQKKQNEQKQKLKHEQELLLRQRQQQALQASKIKGFVQYQDFSKKLPFQNKATPSKQPICIDLDEEDSQQKPAAKNENQPKGQEKHKTQQAERSNLKVEGKNSQKQQQKEQRTKNGQNSNKNQGETVYLPPFRKYNKQAQSSQAIKKQVELQQKDIENKIEIGNKIQSQDVIKNDKQQINDKKYNQKLLQLQKQQKLGSESRQVRGQQQLNRAEPERENADQIQQMGIKGEGQPKKIQKQQQQKGPEQAQKDNQKLKQDQNRQEQ